MAFNIIVASATFTRPADTTAYTIGDIVANSTSAATPMQFTCALTSGGSFFIRRARVKKTNTTVTNATFRLHLYGALPTLANNDNSAWSTTESSYMGSIDIDLATSSRVFTDGSKGIGAPSTGVEIAGQLATGLIVYGVLTATAAYTPTSGEVFTVELEVVQN